MMPRWLYVLICLVLLTLVMSAWGWVVNASVPSVHAWLLDHIGHAGIWIFFAALWIWAGWTLYRGRKPKGTSGRPRSP